MLMTDKKSGKLFAVSAIVVRGNDWRHLLDVICSDDEAGAILAMLVGVSRVYGYHRRSGWEVRSTVVLSIDCGSG